MAYSLCGTSVDNLGQQECDKAKGVLSRVAIDNGVVAEANYATSALFHAALVGKAKLAKSATEKLFILPEVQELTDSSEANKEGSLNLGFKTVLLEGRPSYKFKFFGGADLLDRCKTFDNQTVRIREFDANGVWWGTKVGTNSKGYQAKLFFTGGKLATGQGVEEGVIECTVSILSVSEYLRNSTWMETTSSEAIDDIVALLDVNLAYVSHVSNVLKYSMKIPGSNLSGAYSIGSTSGAAIAALVASFSALSGAGTPATALAITSMAYDATNDLLAVTYDATAYGTAAGNIKLIPPTPTQLDAGDVTETELLTVTHTKPA